MLPLLREVADKVGMVKTGFELITAGKALHVVDFGTYYKLDVFYDGKFHDIPETVSKAAKQIAAKRSVRLFNVHCLGGMEMMTAAAKAAENSRAEVLGVTLLTSMSEKELMQSRLGFNSIEEAVIYMAQQAQDAGLDGVVASPLEVEKIRKVCGDDFTIVTPGIRPVWAAANDQKRITTPRQAMDMGADYIVIGRPILSPPEGMTRDEAIERIREETYS